MAGANAAVGMGGFLPHAAALAAAAIKHRLARVDGKMMVSDDVSAGFLQQIAFHMKQTTALNAF